jgi:hypothetical protein
MLKSSIKFVAQVQELCNKFCATLPNFTWEAPGWNIGQILRRSVTFLSHRKCRDKN